MKRILFVDDEPKILVGPFPTPSLGNGFCSGRPCRTGLRSAIDPATSLNEVLNSKMLSSLVEPIPGFSLPEISMHSQLTSKITAEIGLGTLIPGIGLCAGLLHDLSKAVLAEVAPDHLTRALEGARLDRIRRKSRGVYKSMRS